jgi:2-hydroxy-3-keto-5-methylthiopentenyl-1-phosphate phosphatase
MAGILVTDFDGTMTREDFYRAVFDLAVEPVEPFWEAYWAGRISHFQAVKEIFARLRGTPEQYSAAIAKTDFDPAAGAAIARLSAAGWSVVIASAGCGWYIQRLLASQRIACHDGSTGPAPPGFTGAVLHTNPGHPAPDGSLVLEAPTKSPFYTPATGIDKEAVVRSALGTGKPVAFAGDGRPDGPPSLLVAPERRFARGWLAGHLTERHESFTRIDRWSEIAEALIPTGGIP